MSHNVLQKISHAVKVRLETRQAALSLSELKGHAQNSRTPIDIIKSLKACRPAVIAEIKFVSPSEGILNPLFESDLRPQHAVNIAKAYAQAGAAAISILTESDFFGGSYEILQAVRRSQPNLPILMKDFMIDEYQIYEARHHGADGILIMLSLLEKDTAKRFLDLAQSLGLSALVEVHDEGELEVAHQLGAQWIGVNNRNLRTLQTSLEISRQLIHKAPRDAFLISESGIESRQQMSELFEMGFQGFLVGTSLMRTDDPGHALKKLVQP